MSGLNNPIDFITSEAFQEAVIGYMASDRLFLIQCRANLPFTNFNDPVLARLTELLYKYFDTYQSNPDSDDEFDVFIKQHYPSNFADQQKYSGRFHMCLASRNKFKLDLIRQYMTSWLKTSKVYSLVLKSAEVYNKGQYDNVLKMLSSGINDINSASFENDDRVRFDDIIKFYEDQKNGYDHKCCTIGSDQFDELLRQGAMLKSVDGHVRDPNDLSSLTKGGLIPGQTTCILGPSNSGKTSSIVSVIAANILLKKYVFLCTHEQNYAEIKDKVIRALTGLKGEQISLISKSNTEIIGKIRYAALLVERFLTYYHWVKAGDMNVESIVGLIVRKQEEMASKDLLPVPNIDPEGKPKGKGYDLVIDDYPGKLNTIQFKNRNWSKHDELMFVYDQFVNLAKQYQFHCIVPAQVNREGFKVNRGDADRMLDQGDVAGSYGIAQIVDNMITINRSPVDIANNTIRYYVAKSRTHTTDSTYISQTDFSVSRTHGFNLTGMILKPGEKITKDVLAAVLKKTNQNKALEDMASRMQAEQEMLLKFDGVGSDGLIKNEDQSDPE